MSEKIKEFENRTGTNLNNRVLDVTEVTRDNSGEIIQIKGQLSRNDEYITKGTPLNATTFNELLKLVNLSLKNYYTTGDLEINWVQVEGQLKTATLKISTIEKLDVIVDNKDISDYIEVAVTTTSNEINITINEKEELNQTTGTTTREFKFDVYLFVKDIDIRIGKIEYTINYINTSMEPID